MNLFQKKGNDLLERLPDVSRRQIMAELETVNLRSGHVIGEPGSIVSHAYFPTQDTLAAFLVPMADGEVIECAVVGHEGAVGAIVSQHFLPSFARCCIHHGGTFLKIPVAALNRLREADRAIDGLLQRYADCLIAQLFQTIACNARHNIEQRTARWLCTVMKQTGSRSISMTQSQLGGFLGVGRSYLAQVVARMRADGILDTRRGELTINQPRRLQALSCECNSLIAHHFGQVMGSS